MRTPDDLQNGLYSVDEQQNAQCPELSLWILLSKFVCLSIIVLVIELFETTSEIQ